jgi:hypothetical protein
MRLGALGEGVYTLLAHYSTVPKQPNLALALLIAGQMKKKLILSFHTRSQ